MLTIAFRRSALLLGLLLSANACSDGPAAPEAREPVEVRAPGILATHSTTYIGSAKLLQRETVLAADEIDSVYVNPDVWSVLTLPKSGLNLYFQPGAVAEPMWVKAVSRKGPKVYYEFYPSPYHFLKPVYVAQDLRNTGAYRDKNLADQLTGAYLPAGDADIASDGTAQVAEVYATYLFNDKNRRQTRLAIFGVEHFSGYILAVGFKRTGE